MKAKKTSFFNLQDNIFKYLLISISVAVVGIFVAIAYVLVDRSWLGLSTNGIGFVFDFNWNVMEELYGAAPAILGTGFVAVVATLIAIPISLSISIYFTEYAPRKIRFYLSIFVDLLAAIPSVIYGIWGLWIIAPLIKTFVQQPIVGAIGFIPLFAGPAYGISVSLAVLVLTIMVIPIITSLTTELLSRTPTSLKEGMTSLGATRWETVRHVGVPFAKLGITASILLGLGRAFGETMAVTMVIGNSYLWPGNGISIFYPGTTITSKIASELYEAFSPLQMSSLIELALILLVISLLINIVSRFVMKGIAKRGAYQ
jgi:phosphate transport system permease protein